MPPVYQQAKKKAFCTSLENKKIVFEANLHVTNCLTLGSGWFFCSFEARGICVVGLKWPHMDRGERGGRVAVIMEW